MATSEQLDFYTTGNLGTDNGFMTNVVRHPDGRPDWQNPAVLIVEGSFVLNDPEALGEEN